MAIFSGPTPDLIKMGLGLTIYALFFAGYGHINKWLYLPLDIIIVGGAIETGKARSKVANGMFEWSKRFGQNGWWRNMKWHGISGTLNMFFGHLTWLTYEGYLPTSLHTPVTYAFYATVPVVAFTAYHMGSVAMGTFRVDAVYKTGAVIWLLPLINALRAPTIENKILLLGFAQAFCFVRLWSPLSFTILSIFEKQLKMPPSEFVKNMRWDVAASFGIITGMLLAFPTGTSYPLMALTMFVGFVVAPLLFKEDQRIKAGENGSQKARHIDRDLLTKVVG